jgi:hypothetical protein
MRSPPPIAALPALAALLLAPVLAVGLLAAPAPAQEMHPLPEGPRPLNLRMDEADVVAIGTVASVDTGRISIHDATVLRGDAPAAFPIKRAPADPPPLAVGHQVVLFLRGVRPPYVLVDTPRELVVLHGDTEVEHWRAGLDALLHAEDDRERLLTVYLGWLDGDDASLREAAGAALLDLRSGFLPLDRTHALARVPVALDAARSIDARRVSARLAATDPDAVAALLAGVPGAANDPQVVETALRAGFERRLPGYPAALARAFADGNPEVRLAAVRVAGIAPTGSDVAWLRRLAVGDPDRGVRREAHKVLADIGKDVAPAAPAANGAPSSAARGPSGSPGSGG